MQNDKAIIQALLKLTDISNNVSLPLDKKLHCVLEAMIECLNTTSGSIMILTGRKHLEVRAATNPEIIGVKQLLKEDSPSGWVFKHRQVLSASRDSEDSAIRNSYNHYEKKAYLIAPVVAGDKVIGVLSTTNKRGEDYFSKDEQTIIIGFAGQLIGALENDRLTKALEKKKIELQQKNQKLRKLEAIRKELFNMLIHDLKGPISNIVANIDILTYTTSKDNMEYVAAAQASCDTLYRMTSDLIDITQMEEGSLKLCFEKIAMEDLLTEGIARLHALARVRSVQLSNTSARMGEPCFLYGDRGLLLRVLQNLIINAIHHSQKGQTVEVGYDISDDKWVSFYVRDQGPGVPAEHQTAIFDKFFQVNKNKDGRIYTTGLGLTFCRLAVNAHKGEISIQSDGKKGSCFYFCLPRIQPSSEMK